MIRPASTLDMDILQLAEENLLASAAVVLGIGAVQGAVLGRGIRRRFPRLRAHARAVSAALLALFAAHAAASTLKFASPAKTQISDVAVPQTVGQGADLVMAVLGLNTGFGAVLALSVSVSLVLVSRSAELPGVARYFVFALGVIMTAVAAVSRFTDYAPELFEVAMYAGYQSGMTVGIFAVTARRAGAAGGPG